MDFRLEDLHFLPMGPSCFEFLNDNVNNSGFWGDVHGSISISFILFLPSSVACFRFKRHFLLCSVRICWGWNLKLIREFTSSISRNSSWTQTSQMHSMYTLCLETPAFPFHTHMLCIYSVSSYLLHCSWMTFFMTKDFSDRLYGLKATNMRPAYNVIVPVHFFWPGLKILFQPCRAVGGAAAVHCWVIQHMEG